MYMWYGGVDHSALTSLEECTRGHAPSITPTMHGDWWFFCSRWAQGTPPFPYVPGPGRLAWNYNNIYVHVQLMCRKFLTNVFVYLINCAAFNKNSLKAINCAY